jgi:hypothetical protein
MERIPAGTRTQLSVGTCYSIDFKPKSSKPQAGTGFSHTCLLPHHWGELQQSAFAPDVAALNVASFGPCTERHWEAERPELVRHELLQIQTASTTASGLPQAQPGHQAGALIALDRRYRHLIAGGWRSLSAELEGVPRFDQWKPDAPRKRADKPGRQIRYEVPPQAPDGGGLLLPNVHERCWQLICDRHGLPLHDADTIAAGFWPWALATPGLQLLISEGWEKALAAVSAGWAAVALPGVQMARRLGPLHSGCRLPALLDQPCKGLALQIGGIEQRHGAIAHPAAPAAG